jgi:hypothetical protein
MLLMPQTAPAPEPCVPAPRRSAIRGFVVMRPSTCLRKPRAPCEKRGLKEWAGNGRLLMMQRGL